MTNGLSLSLQPHCAAEAVSKAQQADMMLKFDTWSGRSQHSTVMSLYRSVYDKFSEHTEATVASLACTDWQLQKSCCKHETCETFIFIKGNRAVNYCDL